MEKSSLMATLVLILAMTAMLLASGQGSVAAGPVGAIPATTVHADFAPSPAVSHPDSTVPLTTYPRTVLIETFTGVWCHYCPSETQALHYIDDTTNRSDLVIAELHVCAFAPGQGPCYDDYVPQDNTSNTRGVFYNVCGYPDVFFDGNVSNCGAASSESAQQAEYDANIANASTQPASVQITENAEISGGHVVDFTNVTSGVSGSYNAITYLLEYIDKLNVTVGYGPHDIDHVVRETLYNHPVTLTAGSTTPIISTGLLNSSWNQMNLSVVTFIQENSTKDVLNANTVPVISMATGVASNLTSVLSGSNATITVQVHNTTTGATIPNAAVNLTWTGGGTLSPTTGVTGSDGTFTSILHAPTVSATTTIQVTALVTASGYTTGSGTTSVIVNPRISPLVPTALLVSAESAQVSLNWTAPSSGSTGLNYHLYRATTSTGTFTQVGTSTSPIFTDKTPTSGQSYWYKVSAENTGGFSPNTTAIPATAVTVTPQGLPTGMGWWISVGASNFSSPTGAALSLYLPSGFFVYQFGPDSYAYVGSTLPGSDTASGTSLAIPAAFAPRYANLEGTVSPATATVTLAGSPLSLTSGSFQELLKAGTYTLNVTAPGYVANDTSVVLTPGNLTEVTVQLTGVTPTTSPASSSNSGPSTDELIALVGAIGVAVVLVLGAVVVSSKGKRTSPPRNRRKAPPRPPSSAGPEP